MLIWWKAQHELGPLSQKSVLIQRIPLKVIKDTDTPVGFHQVPGDFILGCGLFQFFKTQYQTIQATCEWLILLKIELILQKRWWSVWNIFKTLSSPLGTLCQQPGNGQELHQHESFQKAWFPEVVHRPVSILWLSIFLKSNFMPFIFVSNYLEGNKMLEWGINKNT